jgi:hypothetical protein
VAARNVRAVEELPVKGVLTEDGHPHGAAYVHNGCQDPFGRCTVLECELLRTVRNLSHAAARARPAVGLWPQCGRWPDACIGS